jgi:diguanylate cyclase (GGDEF)-like protein
MILKRTGIGIRIARLIALVAFFAVIVAAILQTGVQTMRDINSHKLALQSTAYALASASGAAVEENNRPKAMASLTAVSRIPNILVATLHHEDGSTLASMGQSVFLENDIFTRQDSNLMMLFKGYLPVTVDVVKGGKIRGQLSILGDISGLRNQLFLTLLAAFLGVMASKPLQKRIVGPMTDITSAIQTIRSTRDYSTNLGDQNYLDETGVMVKAFNGLMSDIRFRDQSLQRLAYHDPLTGLPNRVSFQRSVDEWLEQKIGPKTGAVALLNIHGFRALNDAFSHSVGDAILMTVAASIKSALREDVTLARYGGDEFALLLRKSTSPADVDMALARVHSAFFTAVRIGELELHINLTTGAVMLDGTSDSDEALRHVDLALQEAKLLMTGRVHFFHQALADSVQQDTALGQALRHAARSGDFELHYQPQLDLQSNKISGYEALLRWKHPIRGNISPAVFIPLAERIGLVSVIGDWVLFEGCRQAASWQKQGAANRIVSVNVSLAQILAAGFVEKVRAALRKTGLPAPLLCIELTESIFAGSRYADIIFILETLAKDGVKLALDDFGTGYSSLGYLSKLPFHTIKIDRSFVTDADKSSRKSGMLKSIVEMIQSLDMTVVAEGAETQEELALLRAFKVNKVQGYVVAKPQPADVAFQLANAIDSNNEALTA